MNRHYTMSQEQVSELICAARGNEDPAIDKVLRDTQTYPRPHSGAEAFSNLLVKLERGEHLTNSDVVWLWEEFSKVAQATTLFPVYEAARFHATHQLAKLEGMMRGRGVAVPRE